MIYWLGLTTIALTVVLIAERLERRWLVWIFKPLASTGFLGAAWTLGALSTTYGQVVFVALVLCFLGDVLLIAKSKSLFLLGIVSFLLGHVAFAAGFFVLGLTYSQIGWAAIPTVITAMFVGRFFVGKASGPFKAAVASYVVVISVMVVLAFGTSKGWLIPAAACAFFVSDLSVATDRFVKSSFLNRLWGLPLYYIAQYLFVFSVELAP